MIHDVLFTCPECNLEFTVEYIERVPPTPAWYRQEYADPGEPAYIKPNKCPICKEGIDPQTIESLI
tara:strand:+ start:88 stop:285 length:198 start_codon:yes stop_codon:yes gene_type:complete